MLWSKPILINVLLKIADDASQKEILKGDFLCSLRNLIVYLAWAYLNYILNTMYFDFRNFGNEDYSLTWQLLDSK